MKQSLSIIVGAVFAFVLPVFVFAQGLAGGDEGAGDIGEAMTDILSFIDAVVIPVILSIGFLFFVWGMFLYTVTKLKRVARVS
jgi:hypothetical protein